MMAIGLTTKLRWSDSVDTLIFRIRVSKETLRMFEWEKKIRVSNETIQNNKNLQKDYKSLKKYTKYRLRISKKKVYGSTNAEMYELRLRSESL